ncbi:PREDICTED: uncharacterized protein LOC109588671 [Amphimedon queenslandica]|uniref:SAM domain-containing protein n=1 Tax=Amphimedon queenslandica TaxID=400682 RepID=A0A1X7TBZ8_AMPQE|nr:PREDICTED: uncharacterized protein LOC109588671 [Amphimedon queenslandica]|eukprot:XP_019860368.1 PREDICTED: uncharacterized protein LOC109588671 [Amphimedon queenslandica]
MNCFLSEVTEREVESYTHSHSDAFNSQSSHQKLTIAVQDNSAYGMVVPKGFHIKSSEKFKPSVVTSSTSINPSTIAMSTKSPEGLPEKPGSKTFLDFNRSTLASYDIKKVADLLVKMRLEQYAETFQREQIDGKILIELDESILKEELGIAKKIHRLKLLNIINGDQCISVYV